MNTLAVKNNVRKHSDLMVSNSLSSNSLHPRSSSEAQGNKVSFFDIYMVSDVEEQM